MKTNEELLFILQGISIKLSKLKENEIKKIQLDDFSFSYYRYIESISKLGEPTFIELATYMELSKPTVTIMIDNMIKGGYVKKNRSSDDRRVFHLSLTLKSKTIIESHNKIFKEFSRDISEKFDAVELQNLISLLKRI